MSGDGVVLSRAVCEVLTTWATRFSGACEHAVQQYGRPRDLHSGCWGCTTAFDGWDDVGPCDLCERPCDPQGAWGLPTALTGGVQLLLRICDRCDAHAVDIGEENEMVCEMCRFGLQGGHRLPRPDRRWYHDECLVAASRRGALTASGVEDGAARGMRIEALRVRLLGRRP